MVRTRAWSVHDIGFTSATRSGRVPSAAQMAVLGSRSHTGGSRGRSPSRRVGFCPVTWFGWRLRIGSRDPRISRLLRSRSVQRDPTAHRASIENFGRKSFLPAGCRCRMKERRGQGPALHGVRDLDPAFRSTSKYLAAGRVDSLPRRSRSRGTAGGVKEPPDGRAKLLLSRRCAFKSKTTFSGRHSTHDPAKAATGFAVVQPRVRGHSVISFNSVFRFGWTPSAAQWTVLGG